MNRACISGILAIMSVGFATAPAVAAEKGPLIWSVTPYIWAVDTNVDLSADGTPIGGGTVSFNNLLDTIDASYQIAVETGREGGNWSAFIDLTYLDTSDDETLNVPVFGDLRIDTDSEQWFVDAAVAWWPQGTGETLSLYGGIRYTDLDDQYQLSNASTGVPIGVISSKRDFTDALLGFRYRFELANNWALLTKGDYAFGDSDGIFMAQALFRYAVGRSRQNGVLFGYRYKEAEHEAGGTVEDYDYKGPVVAFEFRF